MPDMSTPRNQVREEKTEPSSAVFRNAGRETESSAFFPLLETVIERIDAEMLGASKPDASNEGQVLDEGVQYICFAAGGRRLAVEIVSTPEVGYVPEIAPLPNLPNWAAGVSNVRGEIVSMVDLAVFLKYKEGIEDPKRRRLIVLQQGDMKAGIIVDAVFGILYSLRPGVSLQDYQSEKSPGPDMLGDYAEKTAVFKDKAFHILDAEKLLRCPRMNRFPR